MRSTVQSLFVIHRRAWEDEGGDPGQDPCDQQHRTTDSGMKEASASSGAHMSPYLHTPGTVSIVSLVKFR